MAQKVRSKGTAALVSISSVYTAVPNCKSVNISGKSSITYDSTVLGGPTTKTHDASGFSEAPTIDIECFYDPADTVHALLVALCDTAVPTNVKVTFADTAPTSRIYNCTGFSHNCSTALTEGLAITFTLQTSGDVA